MTSTNNRLSLLEAAILEGLNQVSMATSGDDDKVIARDLARHINERVPSFEPRSDPYFVETIAQHDAERVANLFTAFCDHLISCGYDERAMREGLELARKVRK